MIVLVEVFVRWGDADHAPAHAEVKQQGQRCVFVLGEADQPVLGPALDRSDRFTGQPLAQIHRKREAHILPAEQQTVQPLALKQGAQTPDNGFDFGQFRHGTFSTCALLAARLSFHGRG